ncbi:MAG: DUF4404 family protein [Proteobacteria bacterium]|nr:DUF4404 family protein [Pseudomonadota bacterium]
MAEDNLRELMSRLRQHLAASESIDDATRANLSQVLHEIDARLGPGEPPPATHLPRLEALAVRFEAGHPALAEALREVVDALGKAGL